MSTLRIDDSRAGSPPGAGRQARRALVIADAGWFTTESLFAELDREDTTTLLLTCLDWRNAWRRGQRPWTWNRPPRRRGDRLWRADLALPTGWMKSFPRLGMAPIARTVRRWLREVAPDSGLTLVMTYPHYLALRRQLAPKETIYLSVDDYRLYWPGQAERVEALEREAVAAADLTACVAQSRRDELRASVPEAAGRIIHLPHGAPRHAIPDRPHARPAPPPTDLAAVAGPRLGYVGSLEDRVDWELLDRLAAHRPDVSLVLIGRPDSDAGASPWHADRRRCLGRPNVRLLGWRDQSSLGAYIAAFDILLIPYATDHAFNQACNPTKIMDYMGSGRPIVATGLPECLLHRDRIHVAEDHSSFLQAIDAILADGSDDGRSETRWRFAREHRCGRVAASLLDRLDALDH
jgi:glycosyltransferase involved in cell wall biosynthesis